MTPNAPSRPSSLLLMIAGAKGAIGSTLAVAAEALHDNPAPILSSMTTAHRFPWLGPPEKLCVAGWDLSHESMARSAEAQGVLPPHILSACADRLAFLPVIHPPALPDLESQTARLMEDIAAFRDAHPGAAPVLINLLPSGRQPDPEDRGTFDGLRRAYHPDTCPDLAYGLAAVRSGVPVANFTPNIIETDAVVEEAVAHDVPLSGRDGKTGQTYFKVVLASALKARNLFVDGWYSLNILGNADGRNLMDPDRARGKLSNKTQLLDDILGYPVGERYGVPAHKVHIDYYPPRGDAKEAWDVIDFEGMFGMPMSLRLNLQGRDSILAAPMVLDLARWMATLKLAGRSGLVPELGFFYKKPVGDSPPIAFQDQLQALSALGEACETAIGHQPEGKETP